jgi:hypothetical protein
MIATGSASKRQRRSIRLSAWQEVGYVAIPLMLQECVPTQWLASPNVAYFNHTHFRVVGKRQVILLYSSVHGQTNLICDLRQFLQMECPVA